MRHEGSNHDLTVGDEVVLRLEDGEVRLLSATAALRRVQALVRRSVPLGAPVVDELLAERREDAVHE